METIQITISEAILWVCLSLVLLLVGFLMAFVWILAQKLKENTKLAHFSLIAGAYALIETKSIKHSDIIRKVVERHIPAPEARDEKAMQGVMDEFNDEWQRFLDPLIQERVDRLKPVKAHPDDGFDVEPVYDPALATKVRVEDLV